MTLTHTFRRELAAGCMILALCRLSGSGAPLAEVSLTPCKAPPAIDGQLDDACWGSAAGIGDLHVLRIGTVAPPSGTRVFLTHDSRWLYLAFQCPNPDMSQVRQIWREHDESVHQDDSVEVFLDPGTRGAFYFHFALSFANVQAEQRVVGGQGDRKWDVPWRSATQVTVNGWTGEAAIPLFIFTGHGDMGKARLNLSRNMAVFGLDAIGEKTRRKLTWLTWAPLKRSFHEPAQFGLLHGLSPAGIETTFLPSVIKAEVGSYTTVDGRKAFPVKGAIRNHTVTPGRVRLVVHDQPLSGPVNDVSREILLGAMQFQDFTIHVPVSSLAQRDVTITIEDPTTGEALQEFAVPNTAVLASMHKPLPDRNYYTSETYAHVRCRFGLSEDDLVPYRLVVRTTDGRALSTTEPLTTETLARIPIADLPMGRTELALRLEQDSGVAAAQRKLLLTRREPQPGNEVKIDCFNRVVLKDGKPFFPFGMLCSRGGDHFRLLAENGFNTVALWSRYAGPEGGKTAFESAAQHGLLVIDRYWNYIGRRKSIKDGIGDVSVAIKAVKDYPNLLGYFSVDEPNLVARVTGSFDAVMDDCRMLHETITEHDGYHPVCMLYARYIPPGANATAWADILAFDTYLTGGMAGVHSTPFAMARDVARLDQRAAAANLVAWMVPLAETLGAGRCARGLRPEEHRAQAYLAVINGARGILYFQYSVVAHALTWEVFRELGSHMKVLAPAILAPRVQQRVTYDPGPCDPANGKFTHVQAALFRAPDGPYVLMAANSREHPVRVTFVVPALGGMKPVTRLFADTKASVSNGSFSDQIETLGVRAYELPLTAVTDADIAIHVQMEALPRTRPVEIRTDDGTRQGKRNGMPNPSLETQALPGYPDHVFPIRLEGHPRIGEPGAPFALDRQDPYHGKVSLRVTYRTLSEIPSCLGASLAAYPPLLDAPTHYVLSLFMRGRKAGARVKVNVGGMEPGEKVFTVSTEWKRYSLGGMLTAERNRTKTIALVPVGDGTTVWLDALQFEAGATPTEFTME